MQRVINLCDCLRKNHFYPSIDILQKTFLSQDKHGWIDKKFKEVVPTAILDLVTEGHLAILGVFRDNTQLDKEFKPHLVQDELVCCGC